MTPLKILLKFLMPTAGLRYGDTFHISGRPSPCKLSLTNSVRFSFSEQAQNF